MAKRSGSKLTGRVRRVLVRTRRSIRRAWRTFSGAKRRELAERVRRAMECRDSEHIEKVADAGAIVEVNGLTCQVMHNGVRVVAGAYLGDAMISIIRQLRGHHEPQQEKVFDHVMKHLANAREDAVMIEAGSYWSYYSLWFRAGHPRRRNFMIEPVTWKRQVGERNFALNGFQADFTAAFLGRKSKKKKSLRVRGEEHSAPVWSLPDYMAAKGIDFVEVLHADVQGAELGVLDGAARLLDEGKIGYLIISTHAPRYSVTHADTHEATIERLVKHGYEIAVEHTPDQSFTLDGLVCARGPRVPPLSPIAISRRRA